MLAPLGRGMFQLECEIANSKLCASKLVSHPQKRAVGFVTSYH